MLPMRLRATDESSGVWQAQGTVSVLDNAGVNAAMAPAVRQVERLCAPCALGLIYLNHGLWNYEWIAQTEARGDSVLLAPIAGWLVRLGVLEPHAGLASRAHGAGGLTLPGAAYHDLGPLGVILVGLALALMARTAGALMTSAPVRSALGVILFVTAFLTVCHSLMFLGWAVMSFPFVMFALVATFLPAGLQRWLEQAGRRRKAYA
jgi:hypothetical protein